MDTTPYVNSVFEQPWWLETVAPGRWHEIVVKENDITKARFTYIIDKGKICKPTLTQTMGPWMEDRETEKGNTQLSKQKILINKIFSQLPKHYSIKLCLDSNNQYVIPYRWLGFTIEPSFSYRINDLTDLEYIYKMFHKTTIKNIKGASKKVVITRDTDPELMYELISDTYKRQNRKCPVTYNLIQDIMLNATKHNAGKMFVAKDGDGNVHAAAFLLYDENRCYYLLGGQAIKFKSSGAQNLVLWESIKYASTVSKTFDFEGSMIEGIENFFRQFGGLLVCNYCITKQTLIRNVIDNIKPKIKKIIGYKL